ncbi:MAG: response regulator transcription factor [Lachnospiraceae bacterium]|jgi:two-component system response regulator RegX3|nr:response regulator transcription factor [Lachnospiraceae bacterium]
MHYDCLIVDDEIDLANMTCEYFQMFGLSCICAKDSAECLGLLNQNTIDILLLDINLSGENGFLLCKKIRETWDLPILFISARQSDDDVLTALTIGGDDYIKKPYPLSVLLAKVKIMQKRMSAARIQEPLEEETSLRLQEATLSVSVKGREVRLKPREFYLLQCLYDHKNTIVTKETLFDTVWKDTFYSDGTLNVHIRRLREKIEENPNEPKWIKTVWGIGYILETE